jgi:hypothetical protein
MAGAEGLQDVAVVLAALVGVADQQADRRAGGRPSYTPERISTASGSLRWVTWRLVPGRRRSSRPGWLDVGLGSAAMPGGQPSITQPMAGPWDSPKLVTQRKAPCWPKVLPFMYEDKVTLVEAGDVVHQRPGIRHYLFDYSPDMEYLEIVSPADFKTVDVEPVCPIPPDPLEMTCHPGLEEPAPDLIRGRSTMACPSQVWIAGQARNDSPLKLGVEFVDFGGFLTSRLPPIPAWRAGP